MNEREAQKCIRAADKISQELLQMKGLELRQAKAGGALKGLASKGKQAGPSWGKFSNGPMPLEGAWTSCT